MATETRIWPDMAIPPGETLAETLNAVGMTQADLALRAGRPPQAINEIIRGVKEITPESALQFERVLGVPAHVWVRLEADYRYNKARLEDQERVKNEVRLGGKYPYREMARHGWVPRARNAVERVEALLRFFALASLSSVSKQMSVAFRISRKAALSPEALAAWLRQGEREARLVDTGAFDNKGIRSILPRLRSLTFEQPQVFEPELKKRLAERGVALVLVPHLPGTGAHGATRWLGGKAVVQMSILYSWDDIFWFTFFHELGHILLHGRKSGFIEFDRRSNDKDERAADKFAREHLIPSAPYRAFVSKLGRPSEEAVRQFASGVGIAPSIVVGRLQHDGYLPHSHLNSLRTRFRWAGK